VTSPTTSRRFRRFPGYFLLAASISCGPVLSSPSSVWLTRRARRPPGTPGRPFLHPGWPTSVPSSTWDPHFRFPSHDPPLLTFPRIDGPLILHHPLPSPPTYHCHSALIVFFSPRVSWRHLTPLPLPHIPPFTADTHLSLLYRSTPLWAHFLNAPFSLDGDFRPSHPDICAPGFWWVSAADTTEAGFGGFSTPFTDSHSRPTLWRPTPFMCFPALFWFGGPPSRCSACMRLLPLLSLRPVPHIDLGTVVFLHFGTARPWNYAATRNQLGHVFWGGPTPGASSARAAFSRPYWPLAKFPPVLDWLSPGFCPPAVFPHRLRVPPTSSTWLLPLSPMHYFYLQRHVGTPSPKPRFCSDTLASRHLCTPDGTLTLMGSVVFPKPFEDTIWHSLTVVFGPALTRFLPPGGPGRARCCRWRLNICWELDFYYWPHPAPYVFGAGPWTLP